MLKRSEVNKRYEWYNENGKLHREDGPALEYDSGTKVWYYNDIRHREDGPGFEHPNGRYCWYYENKPHRLDGPAVFGNHSSSWYFHGKLLKFDEFKKHEKLISYRDKYIKALELNDMLHKMLNSMSLDNDNYYKIPKKIIDHFYLQFRQIYEHSKIQQHPQNI